MTVYEVNLFMFSQLFILYLLNYEVATKFSLSEPVMLQVHIRGLQPGDYPKSSRVDLKNEYDGLY